MNKYNSDENFRKFREFFNTDLEIKELIHGLSPIMIKDPYNDRELYEYVVKTLKPGLELLGSKFKILLSNYSDYYVNFFNVLFASWKKRLNSLHPKFSTYEDYYEFYENCLLNISQKVIDEIYNNCVGYSLFAIPDISVVYSANELLMFLHKSYTNDLGTYESLPLVDSKDLDDSGFNKVNLYGNDSEFGRKVYNAMTPMTGIGETSIISDNDRVYVMIRDKCHAMTMEITLNGSECYIDYFLPKICSVSMINALPGIRKINNNSTYARGSFNCDYDGLELILDDFLKMVPDDFSEDKEIKEWSR